MSRSRASRKRLKQEALSLLSELCTKFPSTFRHEHEEPQPLALGIRFQIAKELEGPVRSRVLNTAFHVYCHRPAYQQALQQPGAVRVDLQGQVVGPAIIAEEVTHAAIS